MANNSGSKIKEILKSIMIPLFSILVAMVIAVFLVMWVKGEGFLTSASSLFKAIWVGSFGNKANFYETLVSTTPILFTGIANVVAFRTGLFNIGTEGQFVIGTLCGVAVALIPGIPSVIHVILVILAGTVGGAIWGAIPGYLKAKTGTNEVVNTIMMNYIGMALCDYFVMGALNLKGQATTPNIQKSAELWRFAGPNYRLNIGLFLAIAVAILIYWFFNKTTSGYEIRAVGINPHAAEYGGINVKKNIVLAMLISGAIAGMGGACHVAGVRHNMYELGGALTGYGFDGITVALLAKNNPIASILTALLLGALNNCSLTLQMEKIPKEIVGLIQAIIIIFVAADYIYKYIGEKKKKGAMIHE